MSRADELKRIDLGAGRNAARAPPALEPGHARRPLERKGRESQQEAIERAERMPWWSQVVDRVPTATARFWVFTIREAP